MPPALVPDPDVMTMSPPTVFVGVAVEEPEVILTSPAVPEEEATDKEMEPAFPVPVLVPAVREMVPDSVSEPVLPVVAPVLISILPVTLPTVVARVIAPDVPWFATEPLEPL